MRGHNPVREVADVLMKILLLLFLILLNAFFAASEIALISLSDLKIRQMTKEDSPKARMLKALLADPGRFLATIQIGITLAGFLASASASESFADPLVALLVKARLPISEGILKTIVVFVITLVLSYFTLVLGELVPKRLAMQKSEEIANLAVRPLHLLSKATSPFVKLLTLSTDGLVRLAGVDPTVKAEEATEEEIRMMVDVGQEHGTIDADEKTMIHNVFEFDNKVAAQVMTHRTDMVGLELDTGYADLMRLVTGEQYSRLPVYRDNPDHIVGILYVKDLLQHLSSCTPGTGAPADRPFNLASLLRPPYRVPDSKPINDLFREMKRNRIHMAVVIDEYGGTAGIVTIEDLLEELVGEIDDEYDQARIPIEQLDATTWQASGQLALSEIAAALALPLPVEDYATLNGYVVSLLGRVPQPGERVEATDAHARYRGHATLETGMPRFDTVKIQLNR